MPLTEAAITDAYQKLSKARFDHWQATERLFMRRAELQKARAGLVTQGLIDGRNETERDPRGDRGRLQSPAAVLLQVFPVRAGYVPSYLAAHAELRPALRGVWSSKKHQRGEGCTGAIRGWPEFPAAAGPRATGISRSR